MGVKERPILMHARSIRGILDGRKTQTRRIIKIDPAARFIQQCCDCTAEFVVPKHREPVFVKCPYGTIGDRLWVRETWRMGKLKGLMYRADYSTADSPEILKWRPSIYMSRPASRLTLEVTRIRVERVQDISEDDAKAEGSYLNRCTCAGMIRKPRTPIETLFKQTWCHVHGYEFKQLWNDTNGKGAWDRNDWVFVVDFRRI
jgi:hypothetical protein